MVERDFTRLTADEKINGIKASKLPDHIRSKYHAGDVRESIAQATEMTIQLGINLGLSPDDAILWARKLQEAIPRSEFDSWVATLLDGGPSIFMNTLSELQTTYPNGAAGVALVRETDPAKIYVWNGTAWEDFGEYQGIELKDKSVTAPKLEDLAVTSQKLDADIKDTLNYYDFTMEEGKFVYTNGTIGGGQTYALSSLIYLPAGEIVEVKAGGSSSVSLISKYDSSGNFLSNLQTGENKSGIYTIKSTGDGMWIRITNNRAMFPHEKVYVKSLDLIDDLSIDQTKLTNNLQKEIGYVPVELMYGEFITSSLHALGVGKVGIGPTYARTKPIPLKTGEAIEFYAISSASTLTLAIVDANGNFEKVGIVGNDSSEPLKYFKATEDCYVVITNNTAYLPEEDFYVKKKVANDVSITPQLLKKPIINFQFDDGNGTDSEVKDIFNDFGLKCGFAVPTSVSDIPKYYAWQREGFEVLSHSINGETMTNSMSSAEAERRMKLSKETLKSLGLDITGWVTPSSSLGSNHLPAVGKYYEFAYTVSLGQYKNDGTQIPYDTLETDTLKLKRVSLESTTYENVIAAIDKTITDGGFLSFYAHDFSRGLTKEILNDILTYVKTKMDEGKCLVLKPTDAYKYFYSVRREDIEIKKGAVTSDKLALGAVGPLNIMADSDSIISTNKFDKNNVKKGYWSGVLGQELGFVENENWSALSNPIPVSPGDVVRLSHASSNGYFLGVSQNNFIVQISPRITEDYNYAEVVVQPNVVAFYTSIRSPYLDQAMVTINEPLPISYMPYSNSKTLRWLSIENDNLEDGSILPRNLNTTYNPNLFNSSTITDGYIVNGTGNLTAFPGYCVSDFIPIVPGKTYKFSSSRPTTLLVYYDENKNAVNSMSVVSSDDLDKPFVYNFSNAYYVRVNVKKDLIDPKDYIVSLEEDFETANGKLDWLKITNDNLSHDFVFEGSNSETLRFKDMNVLVTGDSITESNARASKNWHDYLKERLMWRSVFNDGKSGTGLVKSFQTKQGMLERIDNWPTDVDIILIMGAMNDGTSGEFGDVTEGLPVGEFSDAPGNTSVYAAMHKLMQDLIMKYPNVPIGFISSTPRAQVGARGKCWGIDGWFEEYNTAYREVCAHYSIPFLDLYHQSGLRPWNADNNAMYFSDDVSPNGDGIHPNALGQELMSHKIYEFVKQYM